MPLYNAERHVEAAIRSALASDLESIEVIVVDDGSSDASLAIARSIDDPRLTVLAQPPSGGPSRPRNAGIAHARSAYIALLDADDLLKPHKLSSALTALDSTPCRDRLWRLRTHRYRRTRACAVNTYRISETTEPAGAALG